MSGAPQTGRGIGSRVAGPLLAAVLVLSGPPGVAGDTGFVDGFVELPLMPRMQPVPDSTVAFDTAGGRIVIAFTRTADAPDAVLSFYGDTLDQLGWQRTEPGRFTREGESLTIDFVADGPDTVVRFSLVPE